MKRNRKLYIDTPCRVETLRTSAHIAIGKAMASVGELLPAAGELAAIDKCFCCWTAAGGSRSMLNVHLTGPVKRSIGNVSAGGR